MVFSCGGCGARYRIDEHLFHGKSLRFACRKCGQAHLLRDPSQGGEPVTLLPSEPIPAAAQAPAPRPAPAAPTPVPPARRPTAPVAPAPAPADTWFAIRHGQRIGPFTTASLAEELRGGLLSGRSFLWRPTMAEWVRMADLPELAAILAEHGRESALTAGSSMTPPPPPRPSPSAATPTRAASPGASHRGPAPSTAHPATRPGVPGPAQPPVTPGNRADELFLDLSRPSIDLRKAGEIQPDEPPIRGARSVFRARTPAPKVPPASMEGFPAGLDEEPLFPPPAPDDGDRWPLAEGGMAALDVAAPAARVPAPGVDHHLGVHDFSVMVRRVGNRWRWRNQAIIAAAVLLVAGGVAAFVASTWEDEPEPEIAATVPAERTESAPAGPAAAPAPAREHLRPLSEIEAASPAAKPAVAPRPRTPDGLAAPAVAAPAVAANTPPAAPSLPAVADPAARDQMNRYGNLLPGDGARRDDVPDVKPKTLTTAGTGTLSPENMDKFLQKKFKNFVECKARMTRPTDLPVKVGLAFQVESDGRVAGIQVDPRDGLRDGGLEQCLRGIVAGWSFPPQEQAMTYRTTLVL